MIYAQSLDYEIDSVGSTYYRLVIFRVQDFLKYKQESNNYYQLKKWLKFFNEIQTNSLIKFFSDTKSQNSKSLKKQTKFLDCKRVILLPPFFYFSRFIKTKTNKT